MDTKLSMAILRNKLVDGVYGEKEVALLEDIKKWMTEGDSKYKKFMHAAIRNCVLDLGNGDYGSAAKEINLIHNIPFRDCEKWNEEWFYLAEVARYLSEIGKVDRIRNAIFLLGEVIGNASLR